MKENPIITPQPFLYACFRHQNQFNLVQTFIQCVFTLTRSFTKIQDVSVIFPLFLALGDDNKDVIMFSSSSTAASVSSLLTSLLLQQVHPTCLHCLPSSIIIKSAHGQVLHSFLTSLRPSHRYLIVPYFIEADFIMQFKCCSATTIISQNLAIMN